MQLAIEILHKQSSAIKNKNQREILVVALLFANSQISLIESMREKVTLVHHIDQDVSVVWFWYSYVCQTSFLVS